MSLLRLVVEAHYCIIDKGQELKETLYGDIIQQGGRSPTSYCRVVHSYNRVV